jgi:molecular chaperone Hsp33
MHDTLQRFIFEHSDVRGEIAHLNESFITIIQQHNYPKPIHAVLGEALVASTLLCSTLKFQGQLTLQFQSDGPLKLLVVKCNHQYQIRGVAQFDYEKVMASENSATLLGSGELIVTLQTLDQNNPYQSIIPLHEKGIAHSLENYFAQSEQLSTRLWLAVDDQSAAGILLQLLPKQTTRDREYFWEHAVKLGETISDDELLHLDNETILKRLYHDQDIRLFPANSIQFSCTCNKNRMENAIRILGQAEAQSILNQKQVIIVTCEFCNYHFTFDKIDIANIFHEK